MYHSSTALTYSTAPVDYPTPSKYRTKHTTQIQPSHTSNPEVTKGSDHYTDYSFPHTNQTMPRNARVVTNGQNPGFWGVQRTSHGDSPANKECPPRAKCNSAPGEEFQID